LTSHSIITGGSSGIGLATAKILASRGISVSLIARDLDRLEAAKEIVAAVAKGDARVKVYPCDVRNAPNLQEAVDTAIEAMGKPGWAISSAGIVQPGRFLDQSLDAYEEQIRTNYLGSLYFAKAISPYMVANKTGRLVFISSGAAFVGLFGYSSYGPSKFAVRGLAECLRVELRPHGISVTLVCPGDTDTPQHATELLTRPKVTSYLAGDGKLLTADAVAEKLVHEAIRSRFLVTFGLQLRLLGRMHSLIAPVVRTYQNLLVTRFGSET
jgi:3-dehydrosphinganine reductase